MGRSRVAPPIKDGDWTSVRQAINRLGAIVLGSEATPTFAGLTLTGLTASRLMVTDADKALASADLISWVAGTTNQIAVADDGDGSITLSTPQNIHTEATPTFAGIELGHASDTTLARVSAGVVSIEGTNIAMVDGVLEDLNTLGANPFSGDPAKDFLVGTAVGTLAWESGATVRTSLGLGTGDSPVFTTLTLSSIAAEGSDVDKFLVDSSGVIKYRTGAQVLSDIGAESGDLINYVLPSEVLDNFNEANFVGYLGQIHVKNVNIGYGIAEYTHGATVVSSGYIGGVYSPTQNRIYLVPFDQSSENDWHYIDCADGSVVAYTHGATVEDYAYAGGVYSPVQDRIYFVPHGQSNEANWHYIDCSDGSVVAYAHGLGGDIPVDSAYTGGVYSPAQDRIHLIPRGQAGQAKWHYIDCSDGSVVAYTHNVTADSQAYQGGIYSPTQNRIYFVPYAQGNNTTWHYIQEYSTAEISPSIAASTLFNKF